MRVAAIVFALVTVGCNALSNQVPLLTADPAHTANYRFTSSAHGPLTADATYGTVITDKDNNPANTIATPVMWQPGFTARHNGSEVDVLGLRGNVVATTGHQYRIEGGYFQAGGQRVFLACGRVTPN